LEASFRTALAKGEGGIAAAKPAPAFRDFADQFRKSVETQCAAKPSTVEFYLGKLARLLEFTPLAQARLDKIDEALIDSYVQHRRKTVSPASTNRELATLRKALRLAYEWKIINRVPRIRLLPGERVRTFVLSQQQEGLYLGMAPQPLHDLAMLVLDAGLRVGEVLALQWPDIRLEAFQDAPHGFLHVRDGKTRSAKRTLPLTARVKAILEARQRESRAGWVFTDESGTGPLSRFTVRDQHGTVRRALRLPADAVIHSLRHTMLTRLGEAGVDAFTIMRIAGHSTITVSQKYVHPSREAIGLAIQRLDAANRGLIGSPLNEPKRQLPATVSATVEEPEVDAVPQVV
jgi:integrase